VGESRRRTLKFALRALEFARGVPPWVSEVLPGSTP
jgi:hypothetical protein